jgi:hypothetical protein
MNDFLDDAWLPSRPDRSSESASQFFLARYSTGLGVDLDRRYVVMCGLSLAGRRLRSKAVCRIIDSIQLARASPEFRQHWSAS